MSPAGMHRGRFRARRGLLLLLLLLAVAAGMIFVVLLMLGFQGAVVAYVRPGGVCVQVPTWEQNREYAPHVYRMGGDGCRLYLGYGDEAPRARMATDRVVTLCEPPGSGLPRGVEQPPDSAELTTRRTQNGGSLAIQTIGATLPRLVLSIPSSGWEPRGFGLETVRLRATASNPVLLRRWVFDSATRSQTGWSFADHDTTVVGLMYRKGRFWEVWIWPARELGERRQAVREGAVPGGSDGRARAGADVSGYIASRPGFDSSG